MNHTRHESGRGFFPAVLCLLSSRNEDGRDEPGRSRGKRSGRAYGIGSPLSDAAFQFRPITTVFSCFAWIAHGVPL